MRQSYTLKDLVNKQRERDPRLKNLSDSELIKQIESVFPSLIRQASDGYDPVKKPREPLLTRDEFENNYGQNRDTPQTVDPGYNKNIQQKQQTKPITINKSSISKQPTIRPRINQGINAYGSLSNVVTIPSENPKKLNIKPQNTKLNIGNSEISTNTQRPEIGYIKSELPTNLLNDNIEDSSSFTSRPDIQPIKSNISNKLDNRKMEGSTFVSSFNPVEPIQSENSKSFQSKMRQAQDHVTIKAPYNRIHKLIFGEDPEPDIQPESNEPYPSQNQAITGGFQPQVEPIKSNLEVSPKLINNESEMTPLIHDTNSEEDNTIPLDNMRMPQARVQQSDEQSSWQKLQTLLENAPTKDQFEPSKLRRFAGAISGGLSGAAFGPDEGRKSAGAIVDRPYNNAYQDWATRTGALEKGVGLDINRDKARSGGLQDYIALMRAQNEFDPTVIHDNAAAKTLGEMSVKEPYETSKFNREQGGKRDLENLNFINKMTLDDLKAQVDKDLANIREGGENTRSQNSIDAQNTRAKELRNSTENISKLNRELRKYIADKPTLAIPQQQAYARMMAENEVAKTVSNMDNFFIENKDADGNTFYKLKPLSDVAADQISQYNKYRKEVDGMIDGILSKTKESSPRAIIEELPSDNKSELKVQPPKVQEISEVQSSPITKLTVAQRHFNPLNIKLGESTKKLIDLGIASKGEAGRDGGNFLKFKNENDGYQAALGLLGSDAYANMEADKALKKWSNNGYGANVLKGLDPNKKIKDLDIVQKAELVRAMAKHEGYSTVQTGTN